MFRAIGILTCISTVLLLTPVLQGQTATGGSVLKTSGYTETPKEVLQVIAKAEAQLYSPIDAGLQDVQFTYRLGLNKGIRTFWYKKPDKMKAIYGKPPAKEDEEEAGKSKRKLSALKPIQVEMKVVDFVTRKVIGNSLGKPISCYLPFGYYNIVKMDEEGIFIRFTMTPTIKEKDNFLYTHIDFHLDPEFRLHKIVEHLSTDARTEEHRIKLKPVEEGSKLLVIDEIDNFLGAKAFSTISQSKYHYEKVGPYWMPKKVVRNVQEKGKTFEDEYLNIIIDQGLDDDLFD
jgi:outer membrane lipoprotein-sorting protein